MVNAKDIAIRLYFRRPFWDSIPVVTLKPPENGNFGTLVFKFAKDSESFNVLYRNPERLQKVAQEAVDDFKTIIQDWFKERSK